MNPSLSNTTNLWVFLRALSVFIPAAILTACTTYTTSPPIVESSGHAASEGPTNAVRQDRNDDFLAKVKAEAEPRHASATTAAPLNPALLKPGAAKEMAPAKFKVMFSTTKGDFVVEVTRAWAPIGVDRIYNLVKLGFFNRTAFFRIVPDFVVQFGINGNPEIMSAWRGAEIRDDAASTQSNEKGTLTFARGGPNSRTTQLFINFKTNDRLDKMGGYPPLGKVIRGWEVVEAINQEYGEQPSQPRIVSEGNDYLRREFPRLDYIESAVIVTN